MEKVIGVRIIPRSYAGGKHGHLIYGEANIKVDPNVSHLEVKLVLHATRKDMWEFRACLGLPKSRCAAWCGNWLGETTRRGKKLKTQDKRFAALCCFAMTTISLENIVHESVHAAFEYSRRDNGFPYPGRTRAEERVCYPAGMIANAISSYLVENGERCHISRAKVKTILRKKI